MNLDLPLPREPGTREGELVEDLAYVVKTDARAMGSDGTSVEDLALGIGQYIHEKGLWPDYKIEIRKSPSLLWLADQIHLDRPVILLLGVWEYQRVTDGNGADTLQWRRLGGHYVTVAGTCLADNHVAFSDPWRDGTETGLCNGRVLPPHEPHVNAPVIHNDASHVSHDLYGVRPSTAPFALWGISGYAPVVEEVSNFFGMNWAADLLPYKANYRGGEIHVEVDYAILVIHSPHTVTRYYFPSLMLPE
jgi:hypothetical protein